MGNKRHSAVDKTVASTIAADRATKDFAAKRLLSIEDTADAIDHGQSTVRKLIASGKLRSVKVGSRRLIEPGAIDDFIRDHRV